MANLSGTTSHIKRKKRSPNYVHIYVLLFLWYSLLQIKIALIILSWIFFSYWKHGHLGMIGNKHTRFSQGFFIEGTLHGLHFPHFGAVHLAHFLHRILFLKPVWAPVLLDLNPHLHITSLFTTDLFWSSSTFPIWLASLPKLGGVISYLCSSRISIIGSVTLRFFRLYSFWWVWKYSWSFSCTTFGPMYLNPPSSSSNDRMISIPSRMDETMFNLRDSSTAP